MKLIFILSIVLLSFRANAEIFVCKDGKGRTLYQDKPCATETLRKLDTLPPPSIEEQTLAQERIDRMNEVSQQRATAAEIERQQQEKNDLEQERIAIERRKLELLEKQAALEAEPARYIYVNPRFRYGVQRPHQHRDWHHPKRQDPQTLFIRDK